MAVLTKGITRILKHLKVPFGISKAELRWNNREKFKKRNNNTNNYNDFHLRNERNNFYSSISSALRIITRIMGFVISHFNSIGKSSSSSEWRRKPPTTRQDYSSHQESTFTCRSLRGTLWHFIISAQLKPIQFPPTEEINRVSRVGREINSRGNNSTTE